MKSKLNKLDRWIRRDLELVCGRLGRRSKHDSET